MSYTGKDGESSLPKALLPRIVPVNRKLSWERSGSTSQDRGIMMRLRSVSTIESHVMVRLSSSVACTSTIIGQLR